MIGSACWVVSKPLGVEASALGIRTAWATHQNGFETKLLFAEDGVWCLIGNPGYHTSMLEDFLGQDGEVYCIRQSLELRGIDEDALIDGVEVIDESDVRELCDECETVSYF
ncbi:tRNA 2-thiouridine synthesizing protein C [Desulfobaculum xiamenense]|uniref:tRNA 2-thiouridine synthesizing protein C n=1 Tax=Desulfobaculum xiamenense TaxID=995050 RepID=A0A846QJ45_9BACT|nr:DsrH/TusB family sulfur metabolism protein [Desulfobaculum xiamenense]NJB66492.1 tRNA 2-thiouridine synthesizing protein C [Desulfobaculum xiamenense]